MNKRYLALIIRLTQEQQRLYAAAQAREYVDPAELRRVKRALALLWHLRRIEMSGCSTATPDSFHQDKKGLHSILIKAERVGRAVFVQADS